MSKELTEQWLNGTLKYGVYYLQMKDGIIRTDDTVYIVGEKMYRWRYSDICYVQEILAPVPTYNQFAYIAKKVKMYEKQLSYAMEALNFYDQHGLLGGNCARDVLEKIERVGKNRDLSNNH